MRLASSAAGSEPLTAAESDPLTPGPSPKGEGSPIRFNSILGTRCAIRFRLEAWHPCQSGMT